jgi:hypothetical protein
MTQMDIHAELVVLGLLSAVSASLPGQIGKRVTPVTDLTAIVQLNPLFASEWEVDFMCRDASQNWWMQVNGYLLRLSPQFQTLGAIVTPAGIPIYEPVTDRIYLIAPTTASVQIPCTPGTSGCPWWGYNVYSVQTFRCSFLQLDGSTNFVVQYNHPPVLTSPNPPLAASPDGQGFVGIRAASGSFQFSAQTGTATAAQSPLPAVPFMTVPGTPHTLIATAGSCIGGPSSFCLSVAGHRFPVDLSLTGPGAARGGNLVGVFPLFDQGTWLAIVLTRSVGRTFAYAYDISTLSSWAGCGGGFRNGGPTSEQTQLVADVSLPASVAWLILSPAYLSATIPGLLPASCATYLDPAGHIAASPILLDAAGQGGWQLSLPVIPGIDNSILYVQCLYASLAGFGSSEAKSVVVRQF